MDFTAKSIADKADVGFVLTRISEKGWNSLVPTLRTAVRDNIIDASIFDRRPTHVIDIYKMRRGRYKMVRIWTYIHLGTGEREDLFITNAANQPLYEPIDLFSSAIEEPIDLKEEDFNDKFFTES